MKEYISREWLDNLLDYYLSTSNGAEHFGYGIVKGDVELAPEKYIIKVNHGRWIPYQCHNAFKCSECGRMEFNKEKFCPDCGAEAMYNNWDQWILECVETGIDHEEIVLQPREHLSDYFRKAWW